MTPCKDNTPKTNHRQQLRNLTAGLPPYLYWLHRLLQAYFDWLSGYYLMPPLWRSTPWLELFYGLAQYFGGATIFITALSNSKLSWLLPIILPVGLGLTVAGIAQLQEVVHFCAHNVFAVKIKLINGLVGNALTLLIQTKPFPVFQKNHLNLHHDPRILVTMEDVGNTPFLINELGFKPGQNVNFYWERLKKILGFPSFYLRGFAGRFIELLKAPLYYRLLTLLWFAGVSLAVTLTNSWRVFLLWLILTQFAGYGAALLQQLPEHDWGRYESESSESPKAMIVNKSFVIYLGSAPPEGSLYQQPLAWFWWCGEMAGHTVVRLIFLPLALPGHALHHALPLQKDWPNQLSYLQDFQAATPGWPSKFREIWGFWRAIEFVFASLSAAKETK